MHENTITCYQKLNFSLKYNQHPEKTLGQKIKKLRFIKGLTAKELGQLCGRQENTINAYESDTIYPHYTIMEKICNALGVEVGFFDDDYYSFVLSDNYSSYLKEWRRKNTSKYDEVEKILCVSYESYLSWEKGKKMDRNTYKKISEKLGLAVEGCACQGNI